MNASLTIAASLVAMHIQIAGACGIDTARVLARVGLDEETLKDPEYRLTLAQNNAVWREIVALAGSEAIGLKLGQFVKLPGMGIVGYVMMNASTVSEGMQRFCKYERLLTNIYRTEIAQDKYSLAYVMHCLGPWQPERRYLLDFIMSAVRTLAIATPMDPRAIMEVRFQSEPPADISPYAAVFSPASLKFGCRDTRLIFACDVAAKPIIGANPDLFAAFEQQAQMLLSQYEQDNFSDRVRQKIAQSLQGVAPTLNEIAAQLHLSSRSVQMKLQEEGTSYQMLLNQVRRDLAIAHLQSGDLNKTEIAYLLGFSELSVFSRTFKRWTGKSPSAFQKHNE